MDRNGYGGSLRDGVIRVVLVDDQSVVRAGLKAVLGTAKDIEVIGEGSTGKDAISLAERLDPDVIVMELSMGEMDGAEDTKELVGKKTRGKVLILTTVSYTHLRAHETRHDLVCR